MPITTGRQRVVESPDSQQRLAELRRTVDALAAAGSSPDPGLLLRLKEQLNALQVAGLHNGEQARLAALYHVSSVLGSSLQLAEVLNQVMDAVIQLTGAERGFLILRDGPGGDLRLQAARNLEGKSLDQDDMQISRTLVQQVLHSGQGVVTTNAQRDARFSNQQSVMTYALRSILCVPLRARGEVSGAIYVDNKIKAGVFNDRDLEMMAAFASQAAVAIENARLYTQTDAALAERVAELETLQQIDRQLNTGLDLDRVLDLTLNWALRGTQADSGWIALRPDASSPPVIVAGDGKGASLNPDSPEIAPALQRGEFVTHPADPGRLPYRLIAPLHRETRINALIGVQRRAAPFTPEAEAFLRRLAEHSALALENTRLYQAVQQANLAKSQFVSLVSHELKNPMTSIRGFADIIRQGMTGAVSTQAHEFLDTIVDNVDQMAALVSDLSDISRIETGRLRLQLAAVPLARYLQETVGAMRPQIDARRHTLTLDVDPDLPAVYADRTRLVQIITNLLSNACKYTPEGGRLSLAAHLRQPHVHVAVTDSGIGMSQEDLGRLFTQFFRSEDPAVREQPGWGLGLNVTRRLVELQGGEMGVSSEPGRGSTFWFTLPVAPDGQV
jgi:signal transduction histidine kinase